MCDENEKISFTPHYSECTQYVPKYEKKLKMCTAGEEISAVGRTHATFSIVRKNKTSTGGRICTSAEFPADRLMRFFC